MKAITVKMMTMLLMMLTAVGEALPLRDEDADQDSLARRGSLALPRMSWLMFQENAGADGGSRRSSKGPPRPRGPRRNPQQLPSPGVSRSDLCSRRPPRASFMGRLHRTLEVGRGDREELRRFAQDSPPSRRGLEVGDGRYVVAHTGVYLLAARLSLQLGEVELRLGESVRAAICLKSLCDSGRSIESAVGAAGVGGVYSINLTGMLFIQAGEYASVYVDNDSSGRIQVMPDSFFSAILLGI